MVEQAFGGGWQTGWWRLLSVVPFSADSCANEGSDRTVGWGPGRDPPSQGCIRRRGTSEAAPEPVRQAVGGGCRSGCGRLLSVTDAVEAGTWRQGDSGRASAGRPGGGGAPPPLPMRPPPPSPPSTHQVTRWRAAAHKSGPVPAPFAPKTLVNYYVGSQLLTLKSKMVGTVAQAVPDVFAITPLTFVLTPGRRGALDQRDAFERAHQHRVRQRQPNIWIVKSSHGCKGIGIKIFTGVRPPFPMGRQPGPVLVCEPSPPPPRGCIRRQGTAEAAPAAVRQAVGGGLPKRLGRLLSVANAVEAGAWRQGGSGWAWAGRPGAGEGGVPVCPSFPTGWQPGPVLVCEPPQPPLPRPNCPPPEPPGFLHRQHGGWLAAGPVLSPPPPPCLQNSRPPE